MAASVTNTVSTVFTVNDKASAAILRIANAANSASGAVGRLQQAMQRVNSTRMNAIAPDLRAAVSAAAALSGHMRAMASYAGAIGRMRVSGKLPNASATGGGGGGMALGLGTAASAYYLARNIGSSAKSAMNSILDLQTKYEDMRHTFAGQIQAMGMADSFKEADSQAGLLMVRIRHMAAKLPGDMNYYAQMVQEASTSLFRAGVPNMEGVLDFMGQYGATVYSIAARHKDLGVGARELFAMVGGVARRQMPLFNYLSQYMDKSAQSVERFNKLNPAARFEQLKRALAGFKDSTATAGELASAKMGEFLDRVREIVRIASLPMFERLKDILVELNKYMSENEAKIQNLLRTVGKDFMRVMEDVVKVTKFLVENLDDVWSLTKMIIGAWIASATISGIRGVAAAFYELKNAINGEALASSSSNIAWLISKLGGVGVPIGAATVAAGVGAFLYPSETSAEGEEGAALERRKSFFKTLPEGMAATLENLTRPTAMQDRLMRVADVYGKMGIPTDVMDKYIEAMGYTKEQLQEIMGFRTPSAAMVATSDFDERSKVNYDFRFSRFDIRQNFAEGFDPDRIAVAFATDLARLSEMKLHSSMSPVTGGLSQGGF